MRSSYYTYNRHFQVTFVAQTGQVQEPFHPYARASVMLVDCVTQSLNIEAAGRV